MALADIVARLKQNAVPDPHPVGHGCRECSDARDIAELIDALRKVDGVRRYIRQAQAVHVEISSGEIERRLDGIIGTMFMEESEAAEGEATMPTRHVDYPQARRAPWPNRRA